MRGWRRRVLFGLLAYSAVLVLWASRPWSDTRLLVPPPGAAAGAPPAYRTYDCPSLFSRGPTPPVAADPAAAAPSGPPCAAQGGRRVLFYVDLALVAVAIAGLQRSGVRHRAAAERDRARVAAAGESEAVPAP